MKLSNLVKWLDRLSLLALGSVVGCSNDGARQTQASSAAPVSSASLATAAVHTEQEKALLLRVARQSLELSVKQHRLPELPDTVPVRLREKQGAFVTLTKRGNLRGCIGHILPKEPLIEAVMHNAQAAALQDSRFSPVTPEELSDIHVEVSILTVPEPFPFDSPEDLLKRLRPREHGVVLTQGFRRSTFLPQVWEQLPTPTEFLQHLSAKAGLEPDAWREPTTQIEVYRVEAFEEPKSSSD